MGCIYTNPFYLIHSLAQILETLSSHLESKVHKNHSDWYPP